MSENLTADRIRGCLYGALAGDCLGFPFEEFVHGRLTSTTQDVVKFIQDSLKSSKELQYTDDTSMMRGIIQSLTACNGFNATDMAQKFTENYYRERAPRGYGAAVSKVFSELRATKYKKPFEPAKMQFNGAGSFGNGGAMRVAGAVVFYANDFEKVLETAENQCLLTHTHPDGIMGSILEAAAVYFALHGEPEMDGKSFMHKLRNVMKQQEARIYSQKFRSLKDNPFNKKFDAFERLLTENRSIKDIADELGNSEAALHSVTTAIFCFIRCLSPIPEIEIENPIARTIAYAIAMKGDTDTIATMAGAIAGAYFGDKYIPKSWLDSFEGASDYTKYGKQICRRLFGSSVWRAFWAVWVFCQNALSRVFLLLRKCLLELGRFFTYNFYDSARRR